MPIPPEELVYGLRALDALVANDPVRIREVWMCARGARAASLAARIEAMGLTVQRCDRATLDRLAPGAAHQGVAARVRSRPRTAWRSVLDGLDGLDAHGARGGPEGDPGKQGAPLFLALDQVQDPRNLGACVRSAAAAAVTAVVVPRRRASGVTAVVRRTSAGGVERVPVVEVANLARALVDLAERRVRIVGADHRSEEPVWEADLTGPLAIVIGAEGSGLRRLTRERCERIVAIPMQEEGSSLNLSVAAGILLYEALRQRRRAPAR